MSKYLNQRRAVLAPATLCIATLLSGCSTSDSSGTSASGGNGPTSECAKSAATYLEPYESIPEDLAEDFTPLSAAPEGDKTIIYLSPPVPYTQKVAEALPDAATAAGWQAETINFEPTVEDVNAKFEQAISQKPDAIAVGGWPTSALNQSLEAAKEAGIVVALQAVLETPTDTTGFAAISGGTNTYEQRAEVQANWVAMESDCTAHVAMFGLPYEAYKLQSSHFEETLASVCADCETTYTEVQSTDVGTPAVTNAIVSALQSDPSIKYVGLTVGILGAGLDAALAQAGITDVRIFGSAPDTSHFAALHDGTPGMWQSTSPKMTAWVIMDSVLRVYDTGEPFTGITEPDVMFTPDNIPADADENSVYPADHEDEFKALWKVDD